MIYAAVCGGAFGLEDTVSTAGPGLSLVVLSVMPLIFSLPVSLVVSEMTARYPVEGGNYRWAALVLGRFWGAQAGWWSWLTSAVMNTLYAVLFVSYVKQVFPQVSGIWEWVLACVLIWVAYSLNLKGINLVGNTAIILTIALLLPFAIMVVLGWNQWKVSPMSPFHDPSKSLMASLYSAVMISIWLYAGYEKLSSVAEETHNPKRNFLWALVLASGFSTVSYLLPTIAGLAATGNWQNWRTGYFAVVAGKIGGSWLETSMFVSALLSNFLLLTVTMLAASRVTMTMAQDRVLPARLATMHQLYRTPSASLVFNALTYSLLVLLNFQQLIFLNSIFQIASILLIYITLLAVRAKRCETLPAFQIPLGRCGLILLMLPTCILALIVSSEIGTKNIAVVAIAALLGAVVCRAKDSTLKRARFGQLTDS